MEKNTVELYGTKVYGVEVSKMGLEQGYLDYKALSEIIGDCIFNNTIRDRTMCDWEIVNGSFTSAIFQDYIISRHGFELLRDLTDELVFYNENLDVYVWAIDHIGTAWDYVLTDVKLV